MTKEQIEALKALLAKATPGPWEIECPIDDDAPRFVEAGKQSYEMRCLGEITRASDDINAPEGSANVDLLLALRNNADALCDLALEALELREALEWMASEQCELGCTPRGIYVLSCMQQDKWATIHGEGSTPLEAIQNARRGA